MEIWTAGPEAEGRRLREVLRGPMGLSWSALKSAKWNGRILVNGEDSAVDRRVAAGDLIQVFLPERAPVYRPAAFPLALRIPFEDEYLMVADKPAGLASQSSRNHPDDSLENAVFSRQGCPEGFIFRPVNRLDKGTGGLMVIAKDGHTQDLLQRMLHSPDFLREYLALTEGIPSPREGIIDLPMEKEDAASIRRVIRPDGKPARTLYRVLAEQEEDGFSSLSPAEDGLPLRFPGHPSRPPAPPRALVRLRLDTGRTHQIRVHLSAIGCPVCGDFLYGRELPEEFPGCFALHSAYLRLRHPRTGEILELRSWPAWAAVREAEGGASCPGAEADAEPGG